MTEEEAKTKTCPQTFGWDSTEIHDNLLSSECIASDCMMWKDEYKKMPVITIDNKSKMMDTDEIIGGYCGLAGGNNG